jgi:ADP-ribose pyrophosphatase YjhB (NUDIX family)
MTVRKKHSCCSYCGSPFAQKQAWPRTCGACSNISYRNPLPVGVVLLPVDGGLLCVRRAIEPGLGQLALPGGFLEVDETWQEGCVRELFEETGIRIAIDEVTLFGVSNDTRAGFLLVFGLAAARRSADLPAFALNTEVSEMVVLSAPTELAFPLHTRAMREFFALRGTR